MHGIPVSYFVHISPSGGCTVYSRENATTYWKFVGLENRAIRDHSSLQPTNRGNVDVYCKLLSSYIYLFFQSFTYCIFQVFHILTEFSSMLFDLFQVFTWIFCIWNIKDLYISHWHWNTPSGKLFSVSGVAPMNGCFFPAAIRLFNQTTFFLVHWKS